MSEGKRSEFHWQVQTLNSGRWSSPEGGFETIENAKREAAMLMSKRNADNWRVVYDDNKSD